MYTPQQQPAARYLEPLACRKSGGTNLGVVLDGMIEHQKGTGNNTWNNGIIHVEASGAKSRKNDYQPFFTISFCVQYSEQDKLSPFGSRKQEV